MLEFLFKNDEDPEEEEPVKAAPLSRERPQWSRDLFAALSFLPIPDEEKDNLLRSMNVVSPEGEIAASVEGSQHVAKKLLAALSEEGFLLYYDETTDYRGLVESLGSMALAQDLEEVPIEFFETDEYFQDLPTAINELDDAVEDWRVFFIQEDGHPSNGWLGIVETDKSVRFADMFSGWLYKNRMKFRIRLGI